MAAPTGYTALVATNIQDGSTNLLSSGVLIAIPTDATDTPIDAIAGGAGGIIVQTGAEFPIANGVLGPSGLTASETWAGLWNSTATFPAGSVVALAVGGPYYLASAAIGANVNPGSGGGWTALASAIGPFLADTAQTLPNNIRWRMQVRNALGRPVYTVKGVLFAAAPTHTAIFNLDTTPPPSSALAPSTPGPAGPQGPAGFGLLVDTVTGDTYTVAAVNGVLTLVPVGGSALPQLVIADTANGTLYTISIASGSLQIAPLVGSATVTADTTLIDTVTSSHYTLTVANGAAELVAVSSSVAGLPSLQLTDTVTSAVRRLMVTNGAFQVA